MSSSFRLDTSGHSRFQVIREDGERTWCRVRRNDADGNEHVVLAVRLSAERSTAADRDRLTHEHGLKEELDSAWALRPLELLREGGRTLLLFEDFDGEPLDAQLGAPLEMGRFLRLAVGMVAAVGQVHQRGLIHKDLKPSHILVNRSTEEVRLTGFGIASRLPREWQAPEPPEFIAGSLAYMAPEQTGRMNRSIDARSDLYALGVTLYQMLTGSLPFTATDPTEWVHCHVAKKPDAPYERVKNVPAVVSAIVMKLLAKTAEERYQTAGGVESDLRSCLAQWQARGAIHSFALGQYDTPNRLLIPETLYGREREIDTLLAAFERVVAGGGPELVLVSGYSGIGKSSLVQELHRAVVSPHGLLASGKFDQHQRDIPYATLAQALQGLIRPLLGQTDAELAPWREALAEALGPNGQIMMPLIPELRLFMGPQPPAPELPPQEAQRRFQLVFRRLLGVFARAERPLALFLDDLQWLDLATLDLLEHLATQPELRHLLLVGAYRDNEVTPAHPLVRRLAAIRDAGGQVREIRLKPLSVAGLGRLIADALQCTPRRAAPLARLVHVKTGGNPFFAIQFLTVLWEEGLLAFVPGQRTWAWDLERIRAKGYTDNVVTLLLGKLARLPEETRDALTRLACLGTSAQTATLSIVLGVPGKAVHAALWDAVRSGLVLRSDRAYAFLHDRVQEAAYALIPAGERPTEHLQIGRRLGLWTTPEKVEDNIFEVVNQLNRGAGLLISVEERQRAAELNLMAGKRAQDSMAYNSALTYLAAGRALLAEDCWDRRYALAFSLEFHHAECEFLTGQLACAEARLAALPTHAASLVDLAAVTRLRISLYMTAGENGHAIAVGIEYLRRASIDCSPHPTHDEVRKEIEHIWRQLGKRSIEELIELPPMSDPAACASMDVLAEILPPASWTDNELYCLVVCRMANLSLQYGNSDASCLAYVYLGMILGPHFGDYQAGFRFGQLAIDLVEKRRLDRFKARVYMCFGYLVNPWVRHLNTCRTLLRRAFDMAQEAGDLTFAGYSYINTVTFMLAGGDPLDEVQREAEAGLGFVRKAQFGVVIDLVAAQLGLIRTLRGQTPVFGCFNDDQFDEDRFEQHLQGDPDLAVVTCRYWIRKLQAHYFAQEHACAVAAAAKAEQWLWTSLSFFEAAEYHFYSALAHAAQFDMASVAQRAGHLDALAAHHRQLQEWAEHCPANFSDRAALVRAELARLEGRELDAERLYEQAIRAAQDNGFVQNASIAYELVARFYATRGLDIFAGTYLRKARQGYLRWGADGKVRQLDQLHPQLREEEPAPGPTSTIATPVEHLDLATVIRVSQAVSGEIVLDKLIDTLLRTALAQAGAERGLLFFVAHGGEPRLRAEATIERDTVVTQLRDEPVTTAVLPESILRYVMRTRENVILDDAVKHDVFCADPYIRRHQVRSALCLPLINQGGLVGMLYLENNLTPRVFMPTHIAVLKLLASQAAITLENALLYRDLAEREAKIRRLVDANIVGIFIWDLAGQILDANDAFLRIVGYDREDLVSGRMCWTNLTPPEWLDRDIQQRIPELRMTGTLQPFEKEFSRKDSSRVPVLIGAATFEEGASQGVGFVLDLTERKRAEAEARESERRYRGVQTELEHSNRAATMGQLTASIAHEVQQPIAATATYASAALRWLDGNPANLEEVRLALEQIVNEAMRAGGIVSGVRDLVRKAPPRKDNVDINEAVREVTELTRGEAAKHGVSVLTVLEDGLPLVLGDRVQLQQVRLNLIVNAIEAMSETSMGPRELLISTSADSSNGVSIAVRDSGPGLPAEGIERAFDPFYTTKADGLGMGLSICRSIVEAHRGRLWVGANVPRGAVFQLVLPRGEVEHAPSSGNDGLPVA
ncbi:trifunctional serine/threonine-protein kinase/ATP-binding protein/sensor histidine kinase [Paraburkholderia sp. RL17-337-BIB-A]|uniref:trifunctional serine/threonine-protein kinase/ATP-binding protein/sensor histidine kinase n=1 Tax=Paraburkholderia sp. RL17-337-BIB-A TaxID=3031636 RepID=UPI0038BC4F60